MKIQVSASVLSADFTRLGEEIRRCEDSGCDRIHVDVMDGHFVPNITIGQVMVNAVRSVTDLPVEAHLMIENPWRYFEEFVNCGADVVMVHAECYGQRPQSCYEFDQYPKVVETVDTVRFSEDLRTIRKMGAKAYAVLNPGTPLCVEGLLEELDGILVMSVNPGFASQSFMPDVLSKIRLLRDHCGFQKDIAIDGGINAKTAPEAVEAGADVLATASYLFGSDDMPQAVAGLKALGG